MYRHMDDGWQSLHTDAFLFGGTLFLPGAGKGFTHSLTHQ